MAVHWTGFIDPTVGTDIYTSGDALGAKSKFENVPERGVIMSFVIIDRDSEEDAIDIALFDTDIAGTADNAAFAPTDAELSTSVGTISAAAGNYATFSSNSLATVDNIGLPYSAEGGVLYFQLVTRATPTYTAATDILVGLGIVY